MKNYRDKAGGDKRIQEIMSKFLYCCLIILFILYLSFIHLFIRKNTSEYRKIKRDQTLLVYFYT